MILVHIKFLVIIGIVTTLGCHAIFAFADGARAIPFCVMVQSTFSQLCLITYSYFR